jgi:hypothetical protein
VKPWERHLSTRQVGASSKPGSASGPRAGTVYVERVECEPCECGGTRIVGSVHSPQQRADGVRDCRGRLVTNWHAYTREGARPEYAEGGAS